jgi:hypothetical protein
MHCNDLCHILCYMGHVLWSGLAECIVLRMTPKKKLANYLSYLEHWINFHIIYYLLYMLIIQVYHDSRCMRDFGRMLDSGRKIRLRLYIPTPVSLSDSDRRHNFERLS